MTDSAIETTTQPPHLVLYDGTCGLCDRSVQWLLRHDPAGTFCYAPLQGETAATVRQRHPEIPAAVDSMVLVPNYDTEAEAAHLRSDAVCRILQYLGGPWRLLGSVGLAVPRPLRDAVYRFIARIRYRVFGTVAACGLPDPETRRRFLP